MNLLKLHLENFKKYTIYEIEFGEGLIGIIGKNGSGKSTIFEAILFALYGEFKNRGYKDTIRNVNASVKDAVVVELDFEFDSVEYKVLREFRGKALSANAKFYKNGELITSGAKEVTNSIIKLTRMSKDAFLHTLFASQKELTSLSNAKPEDRKKMIRKLLGLEKIDFVENELVLKSRELKREISAYADVLLSDEEVKTKNKQIKEQQKYKKELDTQIHKTSKEIQKIKKEEDTLKKELEGFVKNKESKQKALNEIELLQNNIKTNTQNQEKLTNEINELELKAKELKTLATVKSEYEALHVKLKSQEELKNMHLKKDGLEKEQTQLRVQYRKYENDIKELEKECSQIELYRAKDKEIKNALALHVKEIKEKQNIQKQINAEISAENRVVEDTNKKINKIKSLGRESNCPTCTRALLEEYDNVINSLELIVKNTQLEKIDKAKVKLVSVEMELKKSEDAKSKSEKELFEISKVINLIESKQKDLEKSKEYLAKVSEQGKINKDALKELENYAYDEKEHQSIQNDLEVLKIKYEQVLRLEEQLKREESLSKELLHVKSNLEALHVKLQDKQTAAKNINYDESLHVKKTKEFDEVQKEKEDKSNKLHEIQIQITKSEGEIKTIQNALDNNARQIKKVQSKKDDLNDYEKIKLNLAEFKTLLNSKVAPRISAIASDMFSIITKGKYQHIEVSNDFDFFIYDEGKRFPIERYSGGEIDLANLVLRIAISKTLGELSGSSSIGFLAFDEVFGSQDESRRMEILEAFHTIKEQYRQIFLISHEMEIKEMFERVVEV